MAEPQPEMNPRKVRIGLAIISVIFVASVVLTALANGAVGKAIFFAIAAMTLFRAALLIRWLRRTRADAPSA